jgi:hypothetical protein
MAVPYEDARDHFVMTVTLPAEREDASCNALTATNKAVLWDRSPNFRSINV